MILYKRFLININTTKKKSKIICKITLRKKYPYIILFHRLHIIVGKTEEGCVPGKVLFWALFITFLLEIVLFKVLKKVL